MKTLCYLQIVPTFDRGGSPTGITAKQVSRRMPSKPLAGAALLKLSIEIPDAVFAAIPVDIRVPETDVRAKPVVVVKSEKA